MRIQFVFFIFLCFCLHLSCFLAAGDDLKSFLVGCYNNHPDCDTVVFQSDIDYLDTFLNVCLYVLFAIIIIFFLKQVTFSMLNTTTPLILVSALTLDSFINTMKSLDIDKKWYEYIYVSSSFPPLDNESDIPLVRKYITLSRNLKMSKRPSYAGLEGFITGTFFENGLFFVLYACLLITSLFK